MAGTDPGGKGHQRRNLGTPGRNIKVTLEYDGTPFAGWQRQRQRPSIQAAVEAALAALTGEPTTMVGAGRTDAGVHALGQVANFRTTSRVSVGRFPAALNAHLPPAIRVLHATEVEPTFHARFSATARTYRYVILNRKAPSAVLRLLAYHVPAALDLDAIAAALPALRGRHAFAAFRTVGSKEGTSECTMRTVEVMRRDSLIIFTFEADRFLRHMVRRLVGTLVLVGRGLLPPEAVGELLAGSRAYRAGPTAPAHGLFLVGITY
jgi:tRNA pseudouridine38-40 synthase